MLKTQGYWNKGKVNDTNKVLEHGHSNIHYKDLQTSKIMQEIGMNGIHLLTFWLEKGQLYF